MTQLRSSQNSAAILKISCVFEWRRPWGRDYCLIPSLKHSGPQKPRFFWSALCRHQEAGSTSSTSGPISFPEPSLPWTRLTKVAYVPSPEDKQGNGREGTSTKDLGTRLPLARSEHAQRIRLYSQRIRFHQIYQISSSKAALLVSTNNRDLWDGLLVQATCVLALNVW